MLKKIAFVSYCTRDLDEALKFYSDILGLRLLVQNEDWIEFNVGGQRLALQKSETSPSSSKSGAMVWLEAKPIEEAIQHLKKNKINFINELEVLSYGKTASFRDPDGNLIGLYEPPEKNA